MQRKDFLKFLSSFDLSAKKLHKLFDFYSQEELGFEVVFEKDFVGIVGKEIIAKIQENEVLYEEE